ncbi:hypothetical protein MKX01_034931, partial [Papaver californicum]
IDTELQGEIAMVDEEAPWQLYFDSSSHGAHGGAGIIFFSPRGDNTSYSFKLDYPCTNNVAEYESLLIGLTISNDMYIRHLEVIGDSRLLVNQMEGEFQVKNQLLQCTETHPKG